MQIGAMNNPGRDLFAEMRWMSDLKLDFIDLTLEPPEAAPWNVNPKEIRKALHDHGLGVVGHTAYYLPFGCSFDSIRRAAVEEMKRCIELFGIIGVKWINLHPDRHAPFHSRSYIIQQNLKSITEMLPTARDCGVGLMVENVPGEFNSRAQLADLLEALPEVGLHLDIGHCNLQVPANTAEELIRVYGNRLKHVHIHDNKGGYADLHLPIGAGNIDFATPLRGLHAWGYDSTITLEVFSEDHHYLGYSRDFLRNMWKDLAERSPAERLSALAK